MREFFFQMVRAREFNQLLNYRLEKAEIEKKRQRTKAHVLSIVLYTLNFQQVCK